MKVKDITHMNQFIIGLSRNMGAKYPEDTAQEVWCRLSEIEARDGNIDKLEYNGEINKTYLFMIIRSVLADEKYHDKKENEAIKAFLNKEHIPNEKAIMILEALDLLDHKDAEIFLQYIYDLTSERKLAKKNNVSRYQIHNKLGKIREKILKLVQPI